MDLTTNGVVLTDAIEFIEWSSEKLNFLQKKEEEDNEDYWLLSVIRNRSLLKHLSSDVQ